MANDVTRRRIVNVYVPQRIEHHSKEATRILIQLDDGSYLDTQGLEIKATKKLGEFDSVQLTTTHFSNVIFYNPEEVDW